MRSLKFFATICLIAVFAVSCKSERRAAENSAATAATVHTSQIALDWAGIYTGVVPCADCEGIQTTLVLNANNSFELHTKYLGKSADVNVIHGEFVWEKDGNTISLKGIAGERPTKYLVGEGKLFQLDMEGNRMASDVEVHYTLEKVSSLVGHTWKLIEVNGNAVPINADAERQPRITFNVGGSVFGHGGCNTFRGVYVIETGNRIRFSPMAATQMFCMDAMDIEQAFMQALTVVDNYTMNEDCTILSLNRARMAPLARFELVKE